MSHRSGKEKMSKMELMERMNTKDDDVFRNTNSSSGIRLSELEEKRNLPEEVKELEGYKSVRTAELMSVGKMRMSSEGCDFCDRDLENGCCNADCKIFDEKVNAYEKFDAKKPSNTLKPQYHPCYNCPKFGKSCAGIESIDKVYNETKNYDIDVLLENNEINKEVYDYLKNVGLEKIREDILNKIQRSYSDNPFKQRANRTITGFTEHIRDVIADEIIYNPDRDNTSENEGCELSSEIKVKVSDTVLGKEVNFVNSDTRIYINKDYILVDGNVKKTDKVKNYFRSIASKIVENVPEEVVIQ